MIGFPINNVDATSIESTSDTLPNGESFVYDEPFYTDFFHPDDLLEEVTIHEKVIDSSEYNSSDNSDVIVPFRIEPGWAKYDLKVCIDIGDYLLATGGQPMAHLKKWQAFIKVVHLHNVEFHGDKYIWVPVHPSQVNNSSYYEIKDLIIQLAKSSEVYFVFEHTPHVKPTEKYVNEGIEWVKKLIH